MISKYRWIVFFASVCVAFLAFQNCSQHGFVTNSSSSNENLDSELEYGINDIDDGSDDGLSGQLVEMDDNGAINGVVKNDSGATQIHFYVLEDDGGKQHIGETVTEDSGQGDGGTDELGTFEFNVPFEFVCKPVLAYAVDSDDKLTQLSFGPNFLLWGVNDNPAHPCKGITPPPHVVIIFPSDDMDAIGVKKVTILGRCQPGAGPITITGDISSVTTQCNDNDTFQTDVQFKHPQQVNKLKVAQTSVNGMVATDDLELFLDVALPPPPPPPTPPSSGGDGGGY